MITGVLGLILIAVVIGLWLHDRKKPDVIVDPAPVAAPVPNLTGIVQRPVVPSVAPVEPTFIAPASATGIAIDPVQSSVAPPSITGSKPVIPSLVRTPGVQS